MKRTILAAALMALSTPVWANCPTQQGLYELNNVNKDTPFLPMKVGDLVACIHSMRREEEKLKSDVEKLQAANTTAWSAFEDPGTILEAMPKLTANAYPVSSSILFLEELRTGFRNVISVGDESALESIERRIMKPGVLAGLYAVFKPVVLRTIETKASNPMAVAHLAQIKPLIETPYNALLAAQAYAWYHERCVSAAEASNAPVSGTTPIEKCQTQPFADAFEKHYGLKPTLQSAYWLSSMHRRYMRGGEGYIKAWQGVLADISTTLSPPAPIAAAVPVVAAPTTAGSPKQKK